jgi:hypothetical protein
VLIGVTTGVRSNSCSSTAWRMIRYKALPARHRLARQVMHAPREDLPLTAHRMPVGDRGFHQLQQTE